MTRYPSADEVELGYFEPSTQLLAREALARGHEVAWQNRAFFTMCVEGRVLGCWGMRTDANASVAAKVVQRRDVLRVLLARADLRVARGKAFRQAAENRALRYAARLEDPILVRPATGAAGLVAGLDPTDRDALHRAWREATAKGSKFVLVEAPPPGEVLRFLVIGGNCVSVVHRRRSIDLVGPDGPEGRRDWEPVEVSKSVSPPYQRIAEAAAAAIPGLGVAGIDIVIADASNPSDPDDYAILNLSAAPNLVWHHQPVEGPSVDVASILFDHLSQAVRASRDSARPLSSVRNDPPTPRAGMRTTDARTLTAVASSADTLGHRFPPADSVEIGYYELSTHLLALEAMRRGHPVEWVHRSFFMLRHDGELLGFWCTRTNANSAVGAQAVLRKDVTRRLLRARGIAVAKGGTYGLRSQAKARQRAQAVGYPVVVKPSDGTKGAGVTVGVRSDIEFDRAWEVATDTGTRSVIVEKLFVGEDARFLVV